MSQYQIDFIIQCTAIEYAYYNYNFLKSHPVILNEVITNMFNTHYKKTY